MPWTGFVIIWIVLYVLGRIFPRIGKSNVYEVFYDLPFPFKILFILSTALMYQMFPKIMRDLLLPMLFGTHPITYSQMIQ